MLTILYYTAPFCKNFAIALAFQIFILISRAALSTVPLYTSFTYSIDQGFKLLLGRVSFVTVLKHSLYVSLTLTALMTDIVSIMQWVSFRCVDSQGLLTSIK